MVSVGFLLAMSRTNFPPVVSVRCSRTAAEKVAAARTKESWQKSFHVFKFLGATHLKTHINTWCVYCLFPIPTEISFLKSMWKLHSKRAALKVFFVNWRGSFLQSIDAMFLSFYILRVKNLSLNNYGPPLVLCSKLVSILRTAPYQGWTQAVHKAVCFWLTQTLSTGASATFLGVAEVAGSLGNLWPCTWGLLVLWGFLGSIPDFGHVNIFPKKITLRLIPSWQQLLKDLDKHILLVSNKSRKKKRRGRSKKLMCIVQQVWSGMVCRASII